MFVLALEPVGESPTMGAPEHVYAPRYNYIGTQGLRTATNAFNC